ncbi:MAG TPA: T9SS type A sorting domain-containing protein [Bacteroidia bacterium]|jgi:hypothetical protein|nr:T9SS type A sorting domain-containing protein [Bacteroidia bacterium]
MKKFGTLFTTLMSLLVLGSHLNAQSNAPISSSPLFANDITVEANNMANQRHVRIASAFNGWLFAAYIVNDSVSGKGGVVVRYSKNGGINWMPFNGYSYAQHSVYKSCDITVAGLDSAHLCVFLADVRMNSVTKRYEVKVSRYSAEHNITSATSVFFQQLDTNQVYDVALATDYKFAALKDSIYSVGVLYSHKGLVQDSLIFADTRKYGHPFGKKHLIATGPFYRNVTLGYAHSQSAFKGAYIAVWEQLPSANSTLGHLYQARTAAMIDSVWTKPLCLDSLSPLTNGKVRNPSIACQNSNLDNDSSNMTLAVAFDCARNGQMDSLDVMGYFNKTADSTNFWTMFTLAATTNNELQPSLSFDAGTGNFVATYYDSTAGSLPYLMQTFTLPTPNAWTVIKSAYNDNHTVLKAPYPRALVNPQSGKGFFAWTIDPAGTQNGVVLVDGENIFTAVPEIDESGLKAYNMYPNPSSSSVVLPLSTDKEMNVKMTVYTVLGSLAMPAETIHLGGGLQNLSMDVEGLSSGVYFCRIESGSVSHTFRFVVQH